MATSAPLSLLLLPPLTSPPRSNRSAPTLKLPNSTLQSHNLPWKYPVLPRKHPRFGRTPVRVVTGEIASTQAPLEKAQEIVPAASSDGITSTIISALLFTAFLALCVLTIGVIYLAVQDFLQKREREKYEEEEAERKKRERKKRRKSRGVIGPKGIPIRGLYDDDDD